MNQQVPCSMAQKDVKWRFGDVSLLFWKAWSNTWTILTKFMGNCHWRWGKKTIKIQPYRYLSKVLYKLTFHGADNSMWTSAMAIPEVSFKKMYLNLAFQ